MSSSSSSEALPVAFSSPQCMSTGEAVDLRHRRCPYRCLCQPVRGRQCVMTCCYRMSHPGPCRCPLCHERWVQVLEGNEASICSITTATNQPTTPLLGSCWKWSVDWLGQGLLRMLLGIVWIGCARDLSTCQFRCFNKGGSTKTNRTLLLNIAYLLHCSADCCTSMQRNWRKGVLLVAVLEAMHWPLHRLSLALPT